MITHKTQKSETGESIRKNMEKYSSGQVFRAIYKCI